MFCLHIFSGKSPILFVTLNELVSNSLQTCFTNEPFYLIALRSSPSPRLSSGGHVDAILVPAVARWFIGIPVGKFTRTIICPKETAFHVLVIKANPKIIVLSQQHSCQKCLFVSTKWNSYSYFRSGVSPLDGQFFTSFNFVWLSVCLFVLFFSTKPIEIQSLPLHKYIVLTDHSQ